VPKPFVTTFYHVKHISFKYQVIKYYCDSGWKLLLMWMLFRKIRSGKSFPKLVSADIQETTPHKKYGWEKE